MRQRIARRVVWQLAFHLIFCGVLALCLGALLLPAWEMNASASPCFASAGVKSHAAPQGSQDVRLLEPDKPIEREFGGGQVNGYQITLKAGQFAHVVVEQRGIDVVVVLAMSNGAKLTEIDIARGTQGLESIFILAETNGSYRLDVSALRKGAPAGRYEIRVEAQRETAPLDRNRFAAQQIAAEAEQLLGKQTKEDLQRGIAKYEEAVTLWRAVGDRLQEAVILNDIGYIYNGLGEKQKALDYLQQALALRRAVGDRGGEAITLNNLGLVHNSMGKSREALDFFTQALPLRQAAGDQLGEANTLNSIGAVHYSLGETDKAIAYYHKALLIRQALSDRIGEAIAYINIGVAHSSSGDHQKGLQYYHQALPLIRAEGNRRLEADALNNIGDLYQDLGEKRRALEYCNQALALRRILGDRAGEAQSLNNLGSLVNSLGEYQQALGYYTQALDLWRAVKNRREEANTLNNLAVLYRELGEPQKAFELLDQALQISRSLDDRRREAAMLNNLGTHHRVLGDRLKALEYFDKSLAIRRAVVDRLGEAITLGNIGRLHLASGEPLKALDYFSSSLPISRAIGDRRAEGITLAFLGEVYASIGEQEKAFDHYDRAIALSQGLEDHEHEASVLNRMARLESRRGNFNESRGHLKKALQIVERIRANVTSRELRASFSTSVRSYYDSYIDLLMAMHREQPAGGYDAEALHLSERARARSLLELLKEARADIREGVDPALLARERELRQLLTDKTARQIRVLNRKHTAEQVEAIDKELKALDTEYQQIEGQIRATSSHYAALTQPQPLKLAEIQRQVLDLDTLLLEYVLGEERSFLWAATSVSLTSYELPKRDVIEEAAKRVYDLMIARSQQKADETNVQRQARIAQADAGYPAAASELSRMLLAPVAAQLGKKRLVIVGDGRLQTIPFAVLPMPESVRAGDKETGRQRDKGNLQSAIRNLQSFTPLIVNHEIITLPSASTLAVLRSEMSGRSLAPKQVAVLADPVFDVTDLRVKRAASAGQPPAKSDSSREGSPAQNITTRAIDDWLKSGLTLEPLPFSQREAAVIKSLVPESQRKLTLGFDVNYRTATDPELGRYRIVHFSTHGLLNARMPELSGILLSLVDEQGRPQENGLLRLGEIYNLKLPVELVVLSSCQTALGKEVRGEGLIGLTRGFMYAGAARVMASLWKVDDQATAELMQRFYKELLGSQPGRPAEALRRAQIAMWRSKQWSAPFYWGAFTIQGEWK